MGGDSSIQLLMTVDWCAYALNSRLIKLGLVHNMTLVPALRHKHHKGRGGSGGRGLLGASAPPIGRNGCGMPLSHPLLLIVINNALCCLLKNVRVRI